MLLKYYKIEWISHYLPLAFFKNICWFPDFQHIFLTQNFTDIEIDRRNLLYKKYLKYSQICLLSSKSSKKHLIKFAKINKIKLNFHSRVLNFVPLKNFTKLKNYNYIKKKYQIKKNYIFNPNQFGI